MTVVTLANENLPNARFNLFYRFTEPRTVNGNITPAEELLSFRFDEFLNDGFASCMVLWILRHKNHADPIGTNIRQRDPKLLGFFAQKGIRNLDQDAGTIPGERVGTHSAAMRNVAEDFQSSAHDVMAFFPFDMGDEADTAGIVFVAGVIKTLLFRDGVKTH